MRRVGAPLREMGYRGDRVRGRPGAEGGCVDRDLLAGEGSSQGDEQTEDADLGRVEVLQMPRHQGLYQAPHGSTTPLALQSESLGQRERE